MDDIVKSSAESFLETLAEKMTEAATEAVKQVLTWWINVPTATICDPNDPAANCTGDTSVVLWLREHTTWLTVAIAVGAILIATLRMALDRNGRELGQLGKGLVWLAVASTASVTAVNIIGFVGDEYSTWILDEATGGNFQTRLLELAPGAGLAAMSPLFVLMLGFFVMVSGFVQVLLMFGRDAMFVMLTGLLPVAVAGGLTGMGRQSRDRYLAWLLGWALYKPAAATVYAVGFKIVGNASDPRGIMLGLIVFCMAVAVLPALMKVIAPAVSVVTSSGGGGAAAGLAGIGAVATGAMDISGSNKQATTSAGGVAGGGATGGISTPTAVPRQAVTAGGSSGAGVAGAASGGAAAGGAAAAAGPIGAAAAVLPAVAGAGPNAVKKVGGTAASGATGDNGQ